MKKTVNKMVSDRVREPSTWAGFAGVLEGIKLLLPQYAWIIAGLQVIAGGVAVMAKEKGDSGA